VITDLKGELWSVTAGWRKVHAGNKVIRFDPASPKGSACWNPLDEIRMHDGLEVGDVQNLATLIVDPDGKGTKRPLAENQSGASCWCDFACFI
jgi:type IV secretion system protein VirD4